VLLYADSAERWAGRWIDEEAQPPRGSPPRRALRRLRQEYAKQKAIRDTIATRRQAVRNGRAADLRATLALWQQLTHEGATRLCERGRAVCCALGADPEPLETAVDPTLLHYSRDGVGATQMEPTKVYVDATSYAAGEPNLLPITVTGIGGRRIMQINDVHDNLDLLNAIRQLVGRTDYVGLLLRAALIVEVHSLVDLAIGPASAEQPAPDGPPLLDPVDRGRGESGYTLLEQVRTQVVPDQTRSSLLALRNHVAAHLDTQKSYADILDSLRTVNVDDVFRVADNVLDDLDTAARTHVDLGYLAIGHPELRTLKPLSRPTTPATFMADDQAHFLEQPYACFVEPDSGQTQLRVQRRQSLGELRIPAFAGSEQAEVTHQQGWQSCPVLASTPSGRPIAVATHRTRCWPHAEKCYRPNLGPGQHASRYGPAMIRSHSPISGPIGMARAAVSPAFSAGM
jgi:hypothetical protein